MPALPIDGVGARLNLFVIMSMRSPLKTLAKKRQNRDETLDARRQITYGHSLLSADRMLRLNNMARRPQN
jgi:hypothetical protein